MWSGKDKENSDNAQAIDQFGTDSDWDRLRSLGSWIDSTTVRFADLLDDISNENWGDHLSKLASNISTSSSMVRYGVPSVSQYTNCLEKNGRSVWTEDGFWRCLFKGQSPPPPLKQEFTNYNDFLKYQSDLVQKRRKEIEAAASERASQDTFNQEVFDNRTSSPGGYRSSRSSTYSYGDYRPNFGTDQPRWISPEEAAGKNAVWHTKNTETITLDDGTTQRRTQTTKYFDDGTAFSNTTNSSDDSIMKKLFWK